MAKVKIQGHASGTGVFTLTSPNSNTDRTITLPDADVTLGTDATKLPLAGGAMTGLLSNTVNVARNANQIRSNATNLLIENTHASGAAGLRLKGGNGEASIIYGENNSTDKLYIFPRNDTGKQVVIDHVGKVGIGTSSPDEKLDVEGTIQTSRTDGYTANWKQMISHASSSYNGTLYFTGSTSTGGVIFRPNGNPTVSFPVAGGITFGTDTAAANALNDYEEGNHASAWTSDSGSITVGRNDVAYTKIGNMVHCTGEVTISSVSSPAGSRMSLPFTIASHTVDRNMNWGSQGMACYSVAQHQDNPPCLYGSAGASYVTLLYQQDDGAFANYSAAAGDTFMFSFSYKTDA